MVSFAESMGVDEEGAEEEEEVEETTAMMVEEDDGADANVEDAGNDDDSGEDDGAIELNVGVESNKINGVPISTISVALLLLSMMLLWFCDAVLVVAVVAAVAAAMLPVFVLPLLPLPLTTTATSLPPIIGKSLSLDSISWYLDEQHDKQVLRLEKQLMHLPIQHALLQERLMEVEYTII